VTEIARGPRNPAGRPPVLIGARLRAGRERYGISLRELARRLGLSASMVSQIERDQVNPSVSTLYALVSELGLTMNDIFTRSSPAAGQGNSGLLSPGSPIVLAANRAVVNLGSGVRWERLTAGSDALVEFFYVVYDIGGESCPEHSLVRHGGTEYGYLISGRLGIRLGFAEYELTPGDSISFDSSIAHRLWTIGVAPATAIWSVVARQGDSRASA
jgi:transcriptional regulator with XRE-family HTH domain